MLLELKKYLLAIQMSHQSTKIQKAKAIVEWSHFLNEVWNYWVSKGLSPVETPSLVNCPGTEPHLSPFQTELNTTHQKQTMFLSTSPEMHLKKLLCQGWSNIFEIKKCFRNGELSRSHQPEFYLLEWYRNSFSLEELIEDSLEFLSHFINSRFFKGEHQGVQIVTMQELFKKHLDFTLKPQTTTQELLALAKTQQIPFSESDNFEDLFHLLFYNKIETQLELNKITVVKYYPPCMRAFSRINSQGWASRFEIYWRSFELGNAFEEVTDPAEQNQLFEEHLQHRKDQVPKDEELLRLMEEKGLPPCCGIAMGLERIFLALTKKISIAEIKAFPWENPNDK